MADKTANKPCLRLYCPDANSAQLAKLKQELDELAATGRLPYSIELANQIPAPATEPLSGDNRIKELEATLLDAQVQFGGVVESLDEGISIYNLDRRMQYCNSRFTELTGFSREEIYGRQIYEVFFPEDAPEREEFREIMQRRMSARHRGVSEVYETYIYRKDGSRRWIETRAAPIRDSQGRIVGSIGANTDITDRRNLEEQLRWSQKMEAVGRLAGGVAHDFNNLLTAVSGYAELIQRSTLESDRNHRRAQIIHQASETACSLTRQLLTISRRQVVQPKRISVVELVEQTLPILQGLLGGEIELVTDLPKDLPPVYTDPAQLQQVVMNLAINARDAMPSGGVLTISVRLEFFDTGLPTWRSYLKPGSYIALCVKDTGLGMEQSVLSHLFEPFFTTKQGKGTGLGLSTTYAIVKQHSGEITVDSLPNVGTRFDVYLPVASGDPERTWSATKELIPAKGSETILVVEDEPGVRELVCEVLRDNSYNVLEAVDESSALEIIQRDPKAIHLLVSDVVLPGFGGLELTERALKLNPKMKVLLVSGYTQDQALQVKVEKTGAPFLAKPFSPSALAQAVRRILDDESIVGVL